MTIAFDAGLENIAAASPQTWTHTPVGAPKSVTVYLVHTVTASSIVTGVTYGGVAMTLIRTAANGAGNLGRVEVWQLGAGVPAGPQTVSVTRTEGTTTIHGTSISHTAGDDVEVVDSAILNGNLADPQATLGYLGRTCHALCGVFSWKAGVLGVTEIAGCARVQDHDFGAGTSGISAVSQQSAPGAADFTIGYTASIADTAFVAIALSEVAGVDPTTVPVASLGGSSVPRSPAWIAASLRAIKSLADLVKFLATELPKFAQAVMCYERVAVLNYNTVVRPGGDLSRWAYLTVANGTAFLIENPTVPKEGVELSFDIANASGGAMGAVTWGTQYELAGALTNPANGKHRLISFYRAPDNVWRERFRSTNDLN